MENEKRLDLIDRNALLAEYDRVHIGPPGGARKLMEDAPTVDAVEVVHGWWIELPSMEPDYECSECGQSYAWWEPSEAHYCPNCGAKMDGGNEDV